MIIRTSPSAWETKFGFIISIGSILQQAGAGAAHGIFPVRHGPDILDVDAVMDHFADVVEKDCRDQGLAGSFLLFFDHGVEAADRIGLKAAHGTAAVKDKTEFCQILFHCRSLQ